MRQKKKVEEPKTKKKKVEEPKVTQYHQLGEQESMEAYEASKESGGVYRVDYKVTDNLFALVSSAWLSVQEHWIRIGEENHRLVCAVHQTGDEQKIMNKWGYPEGCPFCKFKQQIFESTDKEDLDVVVKAQRSIAKDIASSLNTYMFAIKGEALHGKKRGQRIVTTDFPNTTVKKLGLTRDAFTQFFESFKTSGLSAVDVAGLPVNFITGKKEGQTFASVQRVEFYSDQNAKKQITPLPVPPENMFGNADAYDAVAMEKVFKEFEAAYDVMVTDKVANSKKRSAKRTSGKKKSKK